MTRFFEFRLSALNYWIDNTNRIITDKYSTIPIDNLADTFECQWQNKSTKGHISIFCSLGEWASNITDILKDESLDKCYLEDKEESQRIYRYFTRLLLVVSEILTDFEDMYLVSLGLDPTNKKDRSKAGGREFLFSIKSGEPKPLSEIFNFINNVCKHKSQHIHKCNHHLKVYFADDPTVADRTANDDYIHIDNLDFKTSKSGIIMPKLCEILNTVMLCYTNINNSFDKDPSAFEKVCDLYHE